MVGATDLLAGLVVGVLMLGVTVAVVARAAGVAMLGVIELGGISLVAVTLLAAAGLANRDGHVQLELVDLFTPPRTTRIVMVFSLVVQIAVTLVLLYASAVLLSEDLVRGTTMGGELRLPRAWIGVVLPVGTAVLLLVLVRRLLRLLRVVRRASPPPAAGSEG